MGISVLGRTSVSGKDVASRRQSQLIAALTLHRGDTVALGQFADYLWSDAWPVEPAAAVHTLVSRVRRILPAGFTVESARGGYRLLGDPDLIDAERVDRWRAAPTSGPPTVRLAAAEALLELYRGEPFADLDHVDALPSRARLDDARVELLQHRAEALIELGQRTAAISGLQSLVDERPDRERAVELLMDALYQSGRQSEALATYAHLRAHLREALGVDPSPRLAALELAILRHEIEPAVPSHGPTAVAAAPRSAVPLRTSSLVARGTDIDDLLRLLRRARLVTLLGPGGIGKTTIAWEVASAIERAGTRVLVVELSDLDDGPGAAEVLLDRLGAVRRDGETACDTLARFVSAVPTLLVLDSCEHLLGFVAPLARDLLRVAPTLRVLATSRAPLHLDGEHRWLVRGLAYEDACRLFVERACAVDPGFDAVEHTEQVSQVCRRLDGIPLALELAASLLSFLGIGDVVAGLDDSFGLLEREHSTVPARHRSLAATMDLSFSQLDPPAQEVFARLGVFAGGFARSDVDEVLGAGSARWLSYLVDRSLVVVHRLTATRYELLDTLRSYARLRRGEAFAADRAAHSQWVLDKAEAAGATGSGPDAPAQQVSPDWIRVNMANICVAHRWFMDTGDSESRLRLVRALWRSPS